MVTGASAGPKTWPRFSNSAPKAASGVVGKCKTVQGMEADVAVGSLEGVSREAGLAVAGTAEHDTRKNENDSRIAMSFRIYFALRGYGSLKLLEGVHPGNGF